MHGGRDNICPHWMGEEVARALGGALNKFHSVPSAGHNDLLNGQNHEVTDGVGGRGKVTFFQAVLSAMVG